MPSLDCSASTTTDSTALALAASGDRRPVLLPYFDGERTPNRPDATGVLSGLRSDVSREEFARAAVDGVACGLLDALDSLRTPSRRRRRLMPTAAGSLRARCSAVIAGLVDARVVVADVEPGRGNRRRCSGSRCPPGLRPPHDSAAVGARQRDDRGPCSRLRRPARALRRTSRLDGVTDPFAVLGLGPDATPTTCAAARRELAKRHHPDRGGDPAAMQARQRRRR